jgi:glutaredoxin
VLFDPVAAEAALRAAGAIAQPPAFTEQEARRLGQIEAALRPPTPPTPPPAKKLPPPVPSKATKRLRRKLAGVDQKEPPTVILSSVQIANELQISTDALAAMCTFGPPQASKSVSNGWRVEGAGAQKPMASIVAKETMRAEAWKPLKRAKKKPPPPPLPAKMVEPFYRDPDWRQYVGTNLGGRLRIRVYYNDSTGNERVKMEMELLKGLLEATKRLTRQPHYVSTWIALDQMSKTMRLKIFSKAGNEHHPLVFVDDEPIGNYHDLIRLDKEVVRTQPDGTVVTRLDEALDF